MVESGSHDQPHVDEEAHNNLGRAAFNLESRMINLDIQRVVNILEEVAHQEILPKFGSLKQQDMKHKLGPDPDDPVTADDEEVERLLSQRLTDLVPGSLVVGEEAYSRNHSILNHLLEDDPTFVVGPLDGTRAFAERVIEDQTVDSGNKWTHLWRFPWKMRSSFRGHGFVIKKFGPNSMCLPWFKALLPLSKSLDAIGYWPIVNNFGYGSHALLEKRKNVDKKY